MGTLTIRTDALEDQAIEELKALFGEASASKAILRAVTSYKRLQESDAEFSRRLGIAEKKIKDIQWAHARVNEWQGILKDHLE